MKIFVTVGTQLPFPRLIEAVEAFVTDAPGQDVFAQTGEMPVSSPAIKAVPRLSRAAFDAHLRAADVVVAHAGMGSVLSALETGKRIIVMPRRAALGEHRNDHQLATAAELSRFGTVTVVHDAAALCDALGAAAGNAAPAVGARSARADDLLRAVERFIAEAPLGRRRLSDAAGPVRRGAFRHAG